MPAPLKLAYFFTAYFLTACGVIGTFCLSVCAEDLPERARWWAGAALVGGAAGLAMCMGYLAAYGPCL